MSLLTFGRLKHVDSIIIFVGVILIKENTARCLAVLGGSIAGVVPKYRAGLQVFNDFLRDVELSFELAVLGQPVIYHVERVLNLLFRIGDQFHMILRNPVKRGLEKVRQRGHETILAVATAHKDNDLRKDRLIIHGRVHKEESYEEFLI